MIAATLSFLLLGVVLRGGSAAPQGPTTDAVFQAVLFGGMIAYNATFVLAVLVLLGSALVWRRGSPALSLLAAVIVVVVVLPLPSAGAVRSILPALLAAVLAARAWSAPEEGTVREGPRTHRWARSAFVGAIAVLYGAIAWAHGAPLGLPGTAASMGLAELMAVIVAVSSPFALGCRFDRRSLALSLAVAFTLAAVTAASTLVPLVAMWSVSFSLSFPLPLYVVGAGMLAYAVLERMRATGTRGGIAGMWLLVLAGVGLRTTQEVLLVAVGLLWLLARPPFARPARSRDVVSRPAPATTEVRRTGSPDGATHASLDP